MAEHTHVEIPEKLSFEEAIDLTQALLDRQQTGLLTALEFQQSVSKLVACENGARGFFVVYLSNAQTAADDPSEAIIAALRTAPDIVSPLLIKNLAMSTAMAITHRRNQDAELAEGSDQVQTRSLNLIQHLQIPQLQQEAIALETSLTTTTGTYNSFLQRWEYDAEQRQAIQHILRQTGLV